MRAVLLAFGLCSACQSEPSVPDVAAPARGDTSHFVLAGASVVDGNRAKQLDVEVRAGRIVAVGVVDAGAARIDVRGKFITAAVIDSHVHLAYLPKAKKLSESGVAGVVDLAAPTSFLQDLEALPLQVVAAGPMITASLGYPTQGWGSDGYGLEVASPTQAERAVADLLAAGARVIKVPVGEAPSLDDSTLLAVVTKAHQGKVKVVAHALGDADAARAASAGVDALAHSPVEALAESTLDAWKGRAVISTLSAFGGPEARNNLSALHARGATVLYGTDFGNTRVAGISGAEIDALAAAGLSGGAILESATSAPAEFFGFDGLGRVAPGARACLLVLQENPLTTPRSLASPVAVYRDGVRL